jgi:NhaP-type Na+/H+ or K+/H+ antiporter
VTGVLAFAVTLLLAVLVSGLAHRSVLSTAVLFLGAGFLIGQGALGLISVQPGDPLVRVLAELALFSVLFTDGMRVGIRELRAAWRLPGQALLLGMPLTLGLTALVAHIVAGLPWAESFLLGAALSPTDPVFAAAIVGREDVPHQLRQLLNVESGLNDGLALPVVVVLLAVVARTETDFGRVLADLAGGVALGIAVPWVAIRLERIPFFSAATAYEPLNAFAIGLVVFSLSAITHANEFLAAFAAGITVASTSEEVRASFHRFGELVTELLKLAALMMFGVAVPLGVFTHPGAGGYVLAVLVLLVVRPISIGLALLGTKIAAREWVAAAWFGPKGFASVVIGLLILNRDVARSTEIFDLIALVITVSILAHSSTDVVVARWFRGGEPQLP